MVSSLGPEVHAKQRNTAGASATLLKASEGISAELLGQPGPPAPAETCTITTIPWALQARPTVCPAPVSTGKASPPAVFASLQVKWG